MQMNKENNDGLENDKLAAEGIRNKALETFAETKARKRILDEESPKEGKRNRSSGSDTLQYLRDKAESGREVRMEELEIQRCDKTMRSHQQQRMFQMMQQQMQQAQQQNQHILAVLAQLLQNK